MRPEFFAIRAEAARSEAHHSDHRRQPGIAHAEPGRARQVGAIFARRSFPCGSFIRPERRRTKCWRRSSPKAESKGEVAPFIDDMPAAFARADLVICRAGAGAVAELAAAGKPSILVPLPHCRRSASAAQRRGVPEGRRGGAGARSAKWMADGSLRKWRNYARSPELLQRMGERARTFAHPDAARRAAECAGRRRSPIDIALESRNNTRLKCFLSRNTCTSSESAALA